MNIRRAIINDMPQLVSLFDGYRVFYGQASDRVLAQDFLTKHFEQRSSVIILALDHAGKGLGFTQLYRSFSSVSARHVWILNDLFVNPDARRQGIARKLMEAARVFAQEDGALRLLLETAADNVQAQALYEDLGYAREKNVLHYSLLLE